MTRNNQGPYKVAVTGGIGSGKSTVLAMIRERGYRVLSCDDLAREVTGEPRVLEALRARFGAEIAGQIADSDAFYYLDAPIKRLGAKSTPIPFNPILEAETFPTVPKIVAAVKSLL